VLGSIGFEEPWLHDQHIAAALAASGGRVVYVNPPLSPLSPLRFRQADVRRSRAAALRRRFYEHETQALVLQPWTLPPASRLRRRSARLVAGQIQAALRRLAVTRGVVLDYRRAPELAAIPAARRVCALKDYVPAGASLWGVPADRIERTLLAALTIADRRYAVSQPLRAWVEEQGLPCAFIPHGFDPALLPPQRPPRPRSFATLTRPVLLYAGRIDGRLDTTALARLVSHPACGTLVLMGPVSPRLPPEELAKLRGLPNALVAEPVGRRELPAYLDHADVLVLPYRGDEWGRFGLPLKLMESLAFGPPVIGSGYVTLADFPPPLVYFAPDGDLGKALERALAEPATARTARRDYALGETWARRAEDVRALALGARAA
jgi:glycosyltransferase involved in cell wall biosynthesis